MLDEADLKLNWSVDWLNSYDRDFEAKAHKICALYLNALRFFEQGLWSFAAMKTPACKFCTQIPHTAHGAGQTEKREHEYIPMGCGHSSPRLSSPRDTSYGIWARSAPVRISLRSGRRGQATTGYAALGWVADNLNTHWSLDVCRLVAQRCHVPCVAKELRSGVQRRALPERSTHKHVLHFTPKHGSWCQQVEFWFSVLARRFLAWRFLFRPRFKCVLMTIWKFTTPITPIRIVGRIRDNPRRGHIVQSNVLSTTSWSGWSSSRPKRFERVFYCRGHTSGPPHNWQRTHETDI